jgi:Cell Wall Hydrolase
LADNFGPGGVYGNIPDVDSLGRPGQVRKFLQWNPDPVGLSNQKLGEVHPDLQAIVRRAQADNPNLPFVVALGKSTPEQQRNAIAWGWGQKDNHAGGLTVDLWPLDSQGRVTFDASKQRAIADAMNASAGELGQSLRWGGLQSEGGANKSFRDAPNFQLLNPRPWPQSSAAPSSQGATLSTSLPLSASDRDWVIRTIAGEADHPAGDVAVANVIRNRVQSGQWGPTATDVVTWPGEFSALNKLTGYKGGVGANNLVNLQPSDPNYQRIGKIVDSVWSGQTPDPTGGALNFYAPGGMPGGRAPDWWSQVTNPIHIGAQWYGTAPGQNALIAQRQPLGTTLTSRPPGVNYSSTAMAQPAPTPSAVGQGAVSAVRGFLPGAPTGRPGVGSDYVAGLSQPVAAPGSVIGPPGAISGTQPPGSVLPGFSTSQGSNQFQSGIKEFAQGLGLGGGSGSSSGQGEARAPPPLSAPPPPAHIPPYAVAAALEGALAQRPGLKWSSDVGAAPAYASAGQQSAMSPVAQAQLAQLQMMNSPFYGYGTSLGSLPPGMGMAMGGAGPYGGFY